MSSKSAEPALRYMTGDGFVSTINSFAVVFMQHLSTFHNLTNTKHFAVVHEEHESNKCYLRSTTVQKTSNALFFPYTLKYSAKYPFYFAIHYTIVELQYMQYPNLD